MCVLSQCYLQINELFHKFLESDNSEVITEETLPGGSGSGEFYE